MNDTTIRNLLIVLVLSIIGVACTDNSLSPGNEPAAIRGRVESLSSDSSSEKVQRKTIEGATVTAVQITAEGKLDSLSEAKAETDADGAFSLEVDPETVSNASHQIVVVAKKDGQTAKTFVTAEINSGTIIEVQPISIESSAETEVYQHVIANGDEKVVAKADIEATVNSKVAQDIENNSDHAAEVADALAAYAKARVEFYNEQGIELTEEQLNSIEETKTEALLELESRLNSSSSTSEEAFNTFLEKVAKAETEAEVKATAVAKASEASFRLLIKNCENLSVEARAQLRKNAAFIFSFALEQAVKAQLEVSGAAESSINATTDIAKTLRSDIKAMSNATKEDIDGAFESFNEEIASALKGDTSINGELFVEANTSINQSNGIKATFESSLEGSADLSAMMETYSKFYSEVRSIVESTYNDVEDTEIEAYTELLILINMAS